jgi:hypothetical protein
MDYQKTVELYEKAGQMKRWENEPESFSYNTEKKWFDKVRSKRNGEFYQAQDLINRELVPPEWVPPHVDSKGKPVKYPLKHVNSIIRIRTNNGEYLKSRQMWWGLDEAGNPLNQSMDDKEVMDESRPIYKLRPENPKARDSKMIREVESISHSTKYLLPFSAENAQKLWDMRGNGNCTLVLKDESKGDKHPFSVESFEHFKSREFDELFEMLSTPKYKMDRS